MITKPCSVVEDEPVGFEYPNIERYISPPQKYFDKVETDEQKLRVLTIEEKEQDLFGNLKRVYENLKISLSCHYVHIAIPPAITRLIVCLHRANRPHIVMILNAIRMKTNF
jgi:hypothetical protein